MWLVTPGCLSPSPCDCWPPALLPWPKPGAHTGAITCPPPLNHSLRAGHQAEKERNHPVLLKHHKGHRRGGGRRTATQSQGCLCLRRWLSSKRRAPALQRCPSHAWLSPASPAMPPAPSRAKPPPVAPGRAAAAIGTVSGSCEEDASWARRKSQEGEIIKT